MQNHPNGADGTATIRTFRELIWRRSPSRYPIRTRRGPSTLPAGSHLIQRRHSDPLKGRAHSRFRVIDDI
jgi:hypothetical protein